MVDKHLDLLSVLGNLSSVLVFVNLEAESMLFQNLHGLLLEKLDKAFFDFSNLVSEDLEFFAFDQILVLDQFTDESFEKSASHFDKGSFLGRSHSPVVHVA